MVRATLLLLAAGLLLPGSGCQTLQKKNAGCADGCNAGECSDGCAAGGDCASGECASKAPHPRMAGLHQRMHNCGPEGGPATAQITYPYYNVRGPRDFFSGSEPSIGP